MSKIRKIVDVMLLMVVVLIGLAILFIRFVPRTLVVPDEYKSIQEALNKAKPGETVLIKAGIYKERIKFRGRKRLIGKEMDKVIIQCEAREGHVLFVTGSGGLIKNLTIEQTGKDNVDPTAIPVGIYFHNCSVKVLDCRVSKTDGYGMVIENTGNPVISNCIFESSRLSGIYIVGSAAKPTIENSKFRLNGQHGIYFDRGAKGTAEGNICQENGKTGIYVSQSGTSVTLRNNHCRKNGTHGIYFHQGANGVAEGNLCEENGHSGICVSKPNATATVSGNSCQKNKICGIYFEGPGKAIVENNICSDNIQHGIKFTNGAKGLAENNTCYGNHRPEIFVDGNDTSVILRNNRGMENKTIRE
jgi:parallel beta-helix repeat protein